MGAGAVSLFQLQAPGVAELYPSRQPGSGGEAARPGETLSPGPLPLFFLLPRLPAQLLCWQVAGSPAWGRLPTSGPGNPLFQPNSLYMSLKEKAKCILERESAVEEGAQGGQEGALCQVPGPPPVLGGERCVCPAWLTLLPLPAATRLPEGRTRHPAA